MNRPGPFALRITAIMITAMLLPIAAAQGQTIAADVPLAGDGAERVLFSGPPNPRAVLIMLPGGEGIVDIGNAGAAGRGTNNFLVRTLPLWTAQGYAVEILGSPNGQSLLGQRHTPAYAAAIDRAVDFARSRANAPVWLVGTSQGSTAAANGAASLGGKVAGVVLTSSVTRQNRSGETVFNTNLAAIAVPTLVVANQGDACAATPPEDANAIANAVGRAPRKEVILVQSSEIRSAPCEAMSPHGYLGIEQMVVQRIGNWIR